MISYRENPREAKDKVLDIIDLASFNVQILIVFYASKTNSYTM